jgi:hypothetical protein
MRESRRRIALAVAVLGLLVGGVERARAGLVVVPNDLAGVEGDSNNGFPFNLSLFGDSSMRYQQVYDSSQFSSLGGPVMINQIIFRPDAQTGAAFSSTLPSIQIDLSTTSSTPASLSTTFANNVGADDKVVFGAGPLSLSSAFIGPSGGPKNFDIIINLATPFLYDPSKGNLLMDVRNFLGGGTTQFDAFTPASDGAVSERVWNPDVNATTGTYDSVAAGMVTEFGFGPSAVPEPSTLLTAVSGVLACLGYAWRRRRVAA